MAFSKDKTLQAAQELIGKGKSKEAIAEYQKLLQHDPRDQNALNTIGDLYVRLNNPGEAIRYYTKLADVYVKDGFLVRGIAMFKKISKIDPEDINALERLADLYSMQGLLSEARVQYLQLAEKYLKANQAPQAMQIMQKVLDLDPENVKIQQRLASLYERHGQAKEAAHIYRRLGERELAEGLVDDALKSAEKGAELAPDDAAALFLVARTRHRAGQGAKALAALEKIPQIDEQPEALELLLTLRLETGHSGDAAELAEKLFAADSSKFLGLLQLARHAAREQEGTRALELLQRVAEPALQHDPRHLLEAAQEVAKVLPDPAPAQELAVQAARRAGDQRALLAGLSGLAQAAVGAKDFTRAKQLYDELVMLEPSNLEFSQQLRKMREALGEPVATEAQLVEAPLAFGEQLSAAPAQLELDEETQAYFNSSITDIDLFSSYGMHDKAIELARQLVARLPGHPTASEKLLDLYIGSGNDLGVVEVARRLEAIHRQSGNLQRADEVATLARHYGERLPAGAVPAPPAEVPPAPLVEEAPAAAAPPAPAEVDLSAEWAAATTEEAPAPPAEVMEAAPEVFNPKETGDEIEFYLAQSLFDMARDTLARFEQQFPGEPALAEMRARIQAAAQPAPAPAFEVTPAVAQQPEEVPAAAEGEGETYDVVLEEQPREAAPAGAPMTADSFFSDLAGELDTALAGAAPPAKGAPAAARPAAPAPPAAEPAPPLGVLAEVFEEFRGEMGEAEEVEDIETHYNLGIAYKEMGLLDEAISAFQKASKAAEKQKSHSQFYQCCILLGHCFNEKGHPQIAVRWYERALKVPGVDEEGAMALRYDMGLAHEQAGNRKAALDCFMEVYGANVDYRDVGERIRELQGA